MLAIVPSRDIAIGDTCCRHVFNYLLVKPARHQEANKNGQPPNCAWQQPVQNRCGNEATNTCTKRSFLSRFHALSSYDVNARSVAHDLA